MKTFISDLIPKLQRFSQKLDNLTLLTNKHWVVIDDISNNKNVYIFRTNSDLLLSHNGKVEKAKWEYLGNNSLLIDKKEESFLLKLGFFDENILAFKLDGKNEYAFLINENKYDDELNNIEKVADFLTKNYIKPQTVKCIESSAEIKLKIQSEDVQHRIVLISYETDKGKIEIEQTHDSYVDINEGKKVYKNGNFAPDGKYKLGFMDFIYIKDGHVLKTTYL